MLLNPLKTKTLLSFTHDEIYYHTSLFYGNIRGVVIFMDPIFEIKEKEQKDNYAKFEIGPLAAGYGDTIGTALRRVLMSSLKGSAVTSVRMQGVQHQFSTLKGMKEDVLDFLLNLKRVRFNYQGDEPVKASLSVSRAGEVKAGDIETPSNARVANPELVLANLAEGSKLEVEMTVETGVGYVS